MNRIVSTKYRDRLISILTEDSRIREIKIQNYERSEEFNVGDIVIGVVVNVLKNINACFLEIAPKVYGYLDLSDISKIKFVNYKKKLKVANGDLIIVQISKLAAKTKPITLTVDIGMVGSTVILKPNMDYIAFSSKIESKKFKECILGRVKKGLIIRSHATEVDIDVVMDEVDRLQKKYEKIMLRGLHGVKYEVLMKGLSDGLSLYVNNINKIDNILTDDKKTFDEYRNFLEDNYGDALKKLCFYEDDYSLIKLYSIESKISNLLDKKVWLKSGAYLIIEQTEALTVIDVNTGKLTKGKKREETLLNVNLEAIKEIANQIILRNLSGIILIDFIDIKKEIEDILMTKMKEELRSDSLKSDVIDFTALGLMEITRKREGKTIYELCKNMLD